MRSGKFRGIAIPDSLTEVSIAGFPVPGGPGAGFNSFITDTKIGNSYVVVGIGSAACPAIKLTLGLVPVLWVWASRLQPNPGMQYFPAHLNQTFRRPNEQGT